MVIEAVKDGLCPRRKKKVVIVNRIKIGGTIFLDATKVIRSTKGLCNINYCDSHFRSVDSGCGFLFSLPF